MVDPAGRLGHRHHAPGLVALPDGGGAVGVHRLDQAPARVVAADGLGPVRPGHRHHPPRPVVAGRHVVPAVDDPRGRARRVALDPPLRAGGVDGARHQPVPAPGQGPLRAGGVGEGHQAGQGVVAEAPGRPVGQLHAGEVAQVVVALAHRPAQGVDGPLLLPVLAVVDLGARPVGVDDGAQPPRRGVLEPPARPRRVRPGRQQPRGLVVVEDRPVAQRGDGRNHAPRPVALQAGRVPGGVGGGDQIAVIVVAELHPHARGIRDAPQQAALPRQGRDPAGRVHHGRRRARVPLIGVPGHRHQLVPAVGAGSHRHRHEAVRLVPLPLPSRPARQPAHHQTAALVVGAHGQGPVALAHRDRVAPPVISRGLAPPVGVDHADQAPAPVMDPRIGPRPVLITGLRHIAGQVGETGRAPQRGALGHHPPQFVVGVGHLHHAVGVHHPPDAPPLLPLVAAHPTRRRRLHQPPGPVIAVGHRAPVIGDQARHPRARLVPAHLNGAPPLMG